MFSLQQNQRRGRNRFCMEAGEGEREEVTQTMYTRVSEYESDKIKGKRKPVILLASGHSVKFNF
jgi:hypothetical protein